MRRQNNHQMVSRATLTNTRQKKLHRWVKQAMASGLCALAFPNAFAIEGGTSQLSPSQPQGWQCQQLESGLWQCHASGSPAPVAKQYPAYSPKFAASQPAPVEKKPAFPMPEQRVDYGPSGGTAVEQQIINDMWATCSVQPETLPDDPKPYGNSAEETNVVSDTANAPDDTRIDFNGNVEITRDLTKLNSDEASYNKADETFTATGNVVISEPGLELAGEQARYKPDSKSGRLDNAQFRLPARPARGDADEITFKQQVVTLKNATYTTCPKGVQDWQLSADELTLDDAKGVGTAEDVVLRFKSIPVFYTPYMQFPLNDERKSGFLVPSWVNSDTNGFELVTPYYWNIAPDQDATITPRYMADRGLMLGAEYRYLNKNNEGELYIEYLNDDEPDGTDNDDTTRDPNVDSDRGMFSFVESGKFSERWSHNVNINYTTDKEYFNDFDSNLIKSSETDLLREGVVRYNGDNYDFLTRAQYYQSLDDSETYARLPQFTLNGGQDTLYDMRFDINSELVWFDINEDQTYNGNTIDQVTGSRFYVKPALSYPMERSWGYLTPKAALDYTIYDLDRDENDDRDDSPDRLAQIYSLDGGLYFDRFFNFGDSAMTQTLEPRMYYLYVPEEDHDDIPDFDTGEYDFTYSQLWRDNRFTGHDRIGDANQLSVGVTSRFIESDNGSELLSATFGQIFYFEDREVQLVDTNVLPDEDEDSSSSYVVDLASNFAPNWYTSYNLEYNSHESRTDSQGYRLQYRRDRNHLLNADYRMRRNNNGTTKVDGTDFSGYWKVSPQWAVLGRWNYSFIDDTSLSTIAGIEYDSCCWALRVVASQAREDANDESDNAIMLQLQFKGLGDFGTADGELLQEYIPGFVPKY